MKNRTILLASGSPRRRELLELLGYKVKVVRPEIDETILEGMDTYGKMTIRLAEEKGREVMERAGAVDFPLLAADTIVVLEKEILGKPANLGEAKEMLRKLSDKTHEVVTGVFIAYKRQSESFSVNTRVTFATLSEEIIDYYVNHYEVLDKAGAYAIQEWIGLTGIQKIEGDYFNVVGLPVRKVFETLQRLEA